VLLSRAYVQESSVKGQQAGDFGVAQNKKGKALLNKKFEGPKVFKKEKYVSVIVSRSYRYSLFCND